MYLVTNPEDRFSRDEAHMMLVFTKEKTRRVFDDNLGIIFVIIPLAKRSFSRVYFFQHVHHSEMPSFCHSINI